MQRCIHRPRRRECAGYLFLNGVLNIEFRRSQNVKAVMWGSIPYNNQRWSQENLVLPSNDSLATRRGRVENGLCRDFVNTTNSSRRLKRRRWAGRDRNLWELML